MGLRNIMAGRADTTQHLVVLVGLPGSGKSHAADLLVENGIRWKRVCQDNLGNRGACVVDADHWLREGDSVVIDRVNFDKSQRSHFLKCWKRHQKSKKRDKNRPIRLSALCLKTSKACCQD